MTNPDRVAFSVFQRDIYWYGVLMALGIMIAVMLAMFEAKRKRMNEDTVLDLCLVIIPCGVVGARLYYVLFEIKQYLAGPWWKVFAVWEGGLAIYGSIIGGLLGMFIYARKRKIRFTKLADIIAPGLVLAQAIGRWGNFFNQEAFGLPVSNPDLLWFPFAVKIDVPWNGGLHYFNGVLCDNPFHMATFFYESMWCLLVFLFLWFLFRKRAKHDGDVFLCYIMLYSFERMFIEGLRGDSLWLVEGVVRVSQALSFLLFAGGLAFFLVRYFKEKQLGGALIWPAPEVIAEETETKTEAEEAETKKEEAKEEPEAEKETAAIVEANTKEAEEGAVATANEAQSEETAELQSAKDENKEL